MGIKTPVYNFPMDYGTYRLLLEMGFNIEEAKPIPVVTKVEQKPQVVKIEEKVIPYETTNEEILVSKKEEKIIVNEPIFTETKETRNQPMKPSAVNTLVNTNNGFEVSFEDLKLRGPGDILGTRQSGLPAFILGNLIEDNNKKILGEIDSQVLPSGDIFIKEDGLGKGTSWADAAGPETLDRLLNARISDNVCFDGTTSAWRLGKRKIYLAKGNYTLGTGTLPFTFTAGSGSIEIIGGFYEGSTGKDLTQYAPGTNQTVFTAAKGVRIADVIGTEGGSISLKGITFKGADTSTDGAALNINTDGTLNLTDCTFTGNTTTACGAGLYVSSGRINLDGCRFEQNQAVTTMAPAAEESDTFLYGISRGGAIFAVGKDTDLYLTGCKFRSNLAFVGADIELQKGADAYAYNSYFIGGLAQAGNNFKNYPGRSINADAMPSGEIGALCLCNCTFTKTSSAYTSNGGLPIVAPTNYYCMLVSCTLHDGAVASVRNNNITTRTTTNPDLIWLINNLFVNSAGNAVNLGSASVRHGFYNIMEKGKNAYSDLDATDSKIMEKGKTSYAELDPTDSKVAELDFTTMKYNSEEGYYSWSIDEKQHPVNKPTRAFVSETVQTNCPDFHAWLMSINNNAYGLDQLGTLRNPGAMYPGAWDKGL